MSEDGAAVSVGDAAIVEALAVIISLLDSLEDMATALDRIAAACEGHTSALIPTPGRRSRSRVSPPVPNRKDRS